MRTAIEITRRLQNFLKLSGHYDLKTLYKFGERKKLAIKKILKKPFFTSKLKQNIHPLKWSSAGGGENAYHHKQGLLRYHKLER